MFRPNQIKTEVAFFRALLGDPSVPRVSKFLLGAAIAYLLSPIDEIPDFIPILGQLDDLVIVPLLVVLALFWIPMETKQRIRNEVTTFA